MASDWMDLRDDSHVEARRDGHGRPHAGKPGPDDQNVMDPF